MVMWIGWDEVVYKGRVGRIRVLRSDCIKGIAFFRNDDLVLRIVATE